MSEILLLLEAAPEIVKVVQELYTFAKGYSHGTPKQFLDDLAQAMKQINQSKSHEERQNAAKAMASLISQLPQ